jgi:hypothetical protein
LATVNSNDGLVEAVSRIYPGKKSKKKNLATVNSNDARWRLFKNIFR